MVRTRIAPSPTGYPHIGTIYQALFDYAFAHGHEGKFLVRIEDTDRNRLVEDAEEKIFAALDWFGLTEDESVRKEGEVSPYRQSERLELYKKYAKELISNGGAYYCICSKERLDEVRLQQQKEKRPIMYDEYCRVRQDEVAEKISKGTPYVIRLKVPESGQMTVRDEIRGDVTFDLALIEDSVLVKSDGYPTYHFAVVVDDHLMKVTHVVRGEEWLPSLPKHIMVYDYFGWERPLFFHTPVLRNPDKTKLSKRHGHTNVEWYMTEGFLPEAILNFLALMGWSHPEEKEVFSLDEFIRLFELKDLKPVAPIFDLKKLEWMNGEYIRMMKKAELKDRLLAFDPSITDMKDEYIDRFLDIAQTRMFTLKDFKRQVVPFLEKPTVELTDEEQKQIHELRQQLEHVTNWDQESILEVLRSFTKEHGVNFKWFYRVLIGEDRGLPLVDVFEILGKEQTLELLRS